MKGGNDMSKKFNDVVNSDKFVSLFRRRKLLASLLVLLLLLVATVTIVTLYGLHTGGFTMSVSDELANTGVMLYEKEDGKGVTELNGPELSNVQPIAQPQIQEQYVYNNGGGVYSPNYDSKGNPVGDYVGYTFFLKNAGNTVCDIQSRIKITDVDKKMDEAVRVWVFTTRGNNVDTDGVIYQKADTIETDYSKITTAFGDYRGTTNFESTTDIKTDVYLDVEPEEVIRISIILWVEGEDPDCNNELLGVDKAATTADDIAGGSFKIAMSFTSYKEKIV